MSFILAWLLIGVVTWVIDMARSRPSHYGIWLTALAIHLVIGALLVLLLIVPVSFMAAGFIVGSLADAFRYGFHAGYNRRR